MMKKRIKDIHELLLKEGYYNGSNIWHLTVYTDGYYLVNSTFSYFVVESFVGR